MSGIYDDIAARLDSEQASITGEANAAAGARDKAIEQADAEHEAALSWARDVFEEAMAPLTARAGEVESFRRFIAAQTAAPADPSSPSAPTGDATTSASDEQPANESATPSETPPEPSTPPVEPSTPSEQPEPTPSTESGDASPAPVPTDSPDQAAEVARGVDMTQPIAVPLTTGQIKVVTAGDVIAAQDATIEDDALTTMQLDLRRNSDWP